MAAELLTPNAINRLKGGDLNLRPVLQVMDVRQIGNQQSTQERFRLVLSDSVNAQQAMLATQLNEYIKNGSLQKGSVVQLIEYICNTVQSRKIIIVLNMELVLSVAECVGDPKVLASAMDDSDGPVPGLAGAKRPLAPPMPGQMLVPPQQAAYTASGNNGAMRPGGPGPQVPNGGFARDGNGTFNSHHGTGPANSHGVNPGMNSGMNPGMNSGMNSGMNPGMNSGMNSGMNQGLAQVRNSPGGGPSADGGGFAQQSYGRPIASYQPPPRYSVKGPIARNEAPARIVPIAALNPYQGRWTIKARVTAKGDLRRYHNARGDGKVFSFDLLDADAGEIRCTCFNATADQFYDNIDVGKVYMVTKGTLKPAQKQYNHLKNEWEVLLENASTVELCLDEDNSIPQQIFDFKTIGEVENMEKDSSVDIIGIVLSIQETVPIMKKNGTETLKRNLIVTDKSGRSVEITMWGGFCNKEGDQIQQQIQSGVFPVLVIKAGRVTEFSGKQVGTLNSSQLSINPDIPEAHLLRAWHDTEGKNLVVQSISREVGPGGRTETRKTVSQIKDEGLGQGEKPDWITIRATISFVKVDTFCYTACPLPFNDKQCSKKVTNNGDGTWHCDRCEQTVPECDYRYLLQMQVQDHTGVTWISGFQEAGEEIFGVPARDLFMWKQAENPRFADTVQRVLFSTHLFKLKVKEETFQDEQRVKCTVVKSEMVNFATESKLLLDSFKQIERGEFVTKPAAAGYTPATGYTPAAGFTPASTEVAYGGSGPSFGNSTYNTSYGGNGQGMQSSAGGPGNTMYGGSNSNSTKCFKCGKGGHYSNACPNRPEERSQMGGQAAGGGACYKCGQGGHYAKDCPNQGGSRNFGGGGGDFGNSGYIRRGF